MTNDWKDAGYSNTPKPSKSFQDRDIPEGGFGEYHWG